MKQAATTGGGAVDHMIEAKGLRDYPLARRGFLMTGLISGFTLATARVEAQAIHTDGVGLATGEAKVPVTGGDMPVYYARPASGGPFAIVLVNQEIFGVHEYIQDVCRRLAKAGYLAVAPEIYFRNPDFPKMTEFGADHARGHLQDAGRPDLGRPRCDAGLGREEPRGQRAHG